MKYRLLSIFMLMTALAVCFAMPPMVWYGPAKDETVMLPNGNLRLVKKGHYQRAPWLGATLTVEAAILVGWAIVAWQAKHRPSVRPYLIRRERDGPKFASDSEMPRFP